ncbi:helix-turn-helix domain-containing protein [Marvinbryantia formatexigens]|nr:AraC family transcriptional regulator [Marvinbryantia formatexigens]UWO26458.1 AraC family transcriptional regulator [Marvinbryantia formatexigens DSM 14469]SDF79991.1 AraC-like ligand binding domain-containing protein [Marvinbryantia formatexigens]
MTYESITLRTEFTINEIFSIHYFEYTKDFTFEGETHDFWELVCVDNGSIDVTADTSVIKLKKGEMIFHRPNEFHALRADGISPPNLIVISFQCRAQCMKFFEKRHVTINATERFYLGQILTEARKTFTTPLNNPYICKLRRNENADFGSEHIIRLSLEFLLLNIYRRYNAPLQPVFKEEPAHPLIRRSNEELLEQIIRYLQQNVYKHLTVTEICKANMIGRSSLEKLFHKEKNCGVIEYFCRLKIETAKTMIRDARYNFSEISNLLDYSSYQYFSLQFKKYTRMSPSEYLTSIQNFKEENGEEIRLP